MNIQFQIERLVPRFLLRDKNGYALAKAIERAFQLAALSAQKGLDILLDPDKMPEWRLDEMAGELGCLYDYSGTEEQKRYWIKQASNLYALYGTPQAIVNFLEGFFQSVRVEEYWQYNGDPFHFRVIVSGESYDAAKIAWATRAIERVKNLRSVLDAVTIDTGETILLSVETDHFAVETQYPLIYPGSVQYMGDMDSAEPNAPGAVVGSARTGMDYTG